jgi:hypothetical protein
MAAVRTGTVRRMAALRLSVRSSETPSRRRGARRIELTATPSQPQARPLTVKFSRRLTEPSASTGSGPVRKSKSSGVVVRVDPRSPANRGGTVPTPDPRQIGDGDGDGNRGFRALTEAAVRSAAGSDQI